MFPTVEVRWFFTGEIPADVWEWFEGGINESESQPSRVDLYLQIDDGDSLGIKLREGKIEVKQRSGQQEVIRLGKYAQGYVESWCKWCFELTEPGSDVVGLDSNASRWIGIRKERKIRTYQVSRNQKVVEISYGDSVGQGCAWELVRLKMDGNDDRWWSIGFEAFGNKDKLRDIILLVTDSILSMEKTPKLEAVNSYGYPRWLQQARRLRK